MSSYLFFSGVLLPFGDKTKSLLIYNWLIIQDWLYDVYYNIHLDMSSPGIFVVPKNFLFSVHMLGLYMANLFSTRS